MSVNAAYESLARFVVRFRWPIVAFWIIAAVALQGLPSLGSEVNDDNSAFLPASAPSSRAAELAAPLLGSGAAGNVTQITVVAFTAAPLDARDLTALSRETALLRGVPAVRSAGLVGLSADGRAAQIRVRAQFSANDITRAKTVIDDIVATFRRAGAPPGLHLAVAGQAATEVANQASSQKAGNEVQGLSFLFVIVLLLIVFRSLPAAIVTLAPSGIALAISTRLIGALGAGGLKISAITEILLIVLLIGAGTDYGLFLVFRVREALRDGASGHEAVQRALVRVGESITGSAGTVILALLTLLLASFGLYHDLGVPLAVGVATMLLIGLTLLPALLAILGPRAFWPSKIKGGGQQDGLWGRVAARLLRRPALTLGIGLLFFLGLAAGALGFRSGGFGGATSAPKGSSAAAGNAALARHFPQASSNPADLIFAYDLSLWRDPRAIALAQASLAASDQFTHLAGALDPNGTALSAAELSRLHSQLGAPQRLPIVEPPGLAVPRTIYNAYRTTAAFVSASGRVMQFEATLVAGPQSSTAALNATPRIRAAVAAAGRASGARAEGVAGEAAAVYDINRTANHDLQVVVPVAIVAIGLLLALVLRSAVAPLYLILSVALSYLTSLGVATIVFVDIGGDSGISFILPFLLFVFLLALGEDYNILVMTRIREEARHLPLREAIIKAISRTGSTVTSAGVILGGTFAVFAIVGGGGSGGGQLRVIGFGLAIGILMDTFLVRTLLVPSTVMLLGRANWWPSSLSRRPDLPPEPSDPGAGSGELPVAEPAAS